MIRSTASKDAQVIAATQSADLFSHFNPREVITVNQCDGGTQMRRLDRKELKRWLDDCTLLA